MVTQTGGAASPADPTDEKPEDKTVDQAVETNAAETDANAADSSDADETDANERPSLLSVMRDAVSEKTEADAESSTAESEAGTGPKTEGTEAKADEAEDEADDAALPFHNHPRWQKVIAERNELKPRAERYDQITGFMDQHGLSPQEVSEGFSIMAILKSGEPEKLQEALDWFETRTASLRLALGVDLPNDILQRLDAGEIDETTAAELAKTRASEALREGRDQRAAERTEQDKAREDQQRAVVAVTAAVQGWEEQIRKTDPDYAKKAEMVETTVRAIAASEGPPKTAEDAVKLAQRAYDKVTATFRGFVPPPKPKDTTTPAGSSARTATTPATLRGALEGALVAG